MKPSRGAPSPVKSRETESDDRAHSPQKSAGSGRTAGPTESETQAPPPGASPSRLPQEAPKSSPVVPSLNLSNVKERAATRGGRPKVAGKIEENVIYSDSKMMNEAARRREVESLKMKVKEQRDKDGKSERDRELNGGKDRQGNRNDKEWAYLTSTNLKECSKGYADSSSRQHAMQRVKHWIQHSNPTYETNPSPGVPALVASTNPRESRSMLRRSGAVARVRGQKRDLRCCDDDGDKNARPPNGRNGRNDSEEERKNRRNDSEEIC